jgi:hypothetical protein
LSDKGYFNYSWLEAPPAAKMSEVLFHITSPHYRKLTMSDLDRGIMKFKGADNPIVIAVSAALVLGSIGALVVWALRTAYVVA